MERVAIVGSRDYADEVAVRRYVISLPFGTVVLTGGARGVDMWAESQCTLVGLTCHVYPADWDRHGKAAGMIRNAAIVENCDRLVAFWDGKSRGTADSIAKARKAGKRVDVFQVPTPVTRPAGWERSQVGRQP